MRRCKKGAIEWLEFEQFQEFPEVVHGVFLRHGGVSREPFSSLNVGGGTGDSEELIAENRKRICECLGVEELVSVTQVHGKRVESVDRLDFDTECDGLVTTKPLPLLIKHADCQAAIFFDPIEKAVGAIHCGWRGSVQNIYAHTVETFRGRFGSRPENLLVCISPSLGPHHAEFINHEKELPKAFRDFERKENHFDFWAISRWQLEEAGVLPSHIEIANLCTFSGKRHFFSYRRDKKTGRHGTVVVLKK